MANKDTIQITLEGFLAWCRAHEDAPVGSCHYAQHGGFVHPLARFVQSATRKPWRVYYGRNDHCYLDIPEACENGRVALQPLWQPLMKRLSEEAPITPKDARKTKVEFIYDLSSGNDIVRVWQAMQKVSRPRKKAAKGVVVKKGARVRARK